jgi:hypothetical protein
MTQPTAADVHVSAVLTDWAMQYGNLQTDFKADELAPIVPSKKKLNQFYRYTKAQWFTDEMKKRAEGAAVPMSGYNLETEAFEIDVWSLGKPIDDQTRDNEDDILDSDQDAAQWLMQKERIRREAAFAAACLATSKWSTDVTGNTSASVYSSDTVAQWDDDDADPLLDITTYRTRMKLATGLDGNVLVLGRQVWDVLRNHADILALITGGSSSINPAKVTAEMVASVMELEEIVVMSAVKNTASEPTAMTGAFIAGKHGLLMHRNKNAGRKGATAVKTMTWQRPGADATGIRVLKSAIDIHRDLAEIESNFVHKICATDLGVFFNGLVA